MKTYQEQHERGPWGDVPCFGKASQFAHLLARAHNTYMHIEQNGELHFTVILKKTANRSDLGMAIDTVSGQAVVEAIAAGITQDWAISIVHAILPTKSLVKFYISNLTLSER